MHREVGRARDLAAPRFMGAFDLYNSVTVRRSILNCCQTVTHEISLKTDDGS